MALWHPRFQKWISASVMRAIGKLQAVVELIKKRAREQ